MIDPPSAKHRTVCVAITGASGSLYAEKLIKELIHREWMVQLIVSQAGHSVIHYELTRHTGEFSLIQALSKKDQSPWIKKYQNNNFFAPMASGSSVPAQMVIVPCSMGTLSRVSQGSSTCLIERAADVMLKQRKPLIVCPRETPLNTIQIRSMLTLAEAGAIMVPLMPGFYNPMRKIDDITDFMVGRILEVMGIEHNLYPAWGNPITENLPQFVDAE